MLLTLRTQRASSRSNSGATRQTARRASAWLDKLRALRPRAQTGRESENAIVVCLSWRGRTIRARDRGVQGKKPSGPTYWLDRGIGAHDVVPKAGTIRF